MTVLRTSVLSSSLFPSFSIISYRCFATKSSSSYTSYYSKSRPSSSSTSPPRSPPLLQNFPFDYLIIIDFEATCDNDSIANPHSLGSQEIIEFPMLLYDCKRRKLVHSFTASSSSSSSSPTSNNKNTNTPTTNTDNTPTYEKAEFYHNQSTLGYFHRLVQPRLSPVTPFCTQLTGLTPSYLLSNGIPFLSAWLQANQWLAAHRFVPRSIPAAIESAIKSHSPELLSSIPSSLRILDDDLFQGYGELSEKPKFTFVSVGNSDLATFLPLELSRYSFLPQSDICWRKFINLQRIYDIDRGLNRKEKKASGVGRNAAFVSLMAHYQVKAIGEAHRGVFDVINTAAVVEKMIKRNSLFVNTYEDGREIIRA